LFDGSEATKRDLSITSTQLSGADCRGPSLPAAVGAPVLPPTGAFMQKNVPKYDAGDDLDGAAWAESAQGAK